MQPSPPPPKSPKKGHKNVDEAYSEIADEFAATRQNPWPEFAELVEEISAKLAQSKPREISLLDVGCGNGRLIGFLRDELPVETIEYMGLDSNEALLAIAERTYPEERFTQGTALDLPFDDESFDFVCCIAMLHHLETHEARLKALYEIKRVMKTDCRLMLTVWNLWQPKYEKYIHKKTGDALISWGKDKKVKRYYHAFLADEVIELLENAGFEDIRRLEKAEHNFAFICRV